MSMLLCHVDTEDTSFSKGNIVMTHCKYNTKAFLVQYFSKFINGERYNELGVRLFDLCTKFWLDSPIGRGYGCRPVPTMY